MFKWHNFIIIRYFATCHPLKPSLQSGKPRAVTMIVLIWIICLIPSICWSLYSKVFSKIFVMINTLVIHNILWNFRYSISAYISKNKFQVEYTFYSTSKDPKIRVTMKDEKHYNDQGFTRIQESAMCVVRA